MTERAVKLHGRIVFTATIVLKTGLHIGGSGGGLEIGGVDKPVIRNQFNNQPYIPGSSLKGKMRSLTEKVSMAPQRYPINLNAGVFIHTPRNKEEYEQFPVGSIFGTLPSVGEGDTKFTVSVPTRLLVRDVQLTSESAAQLLALNTDLPYTEVKTEAAIDRVTSAATPRQIERVPAGARFGPAQIIFNVYTSATERPGDIAVLFHHVIEALQYLEDDYLGGLGTRGSGQIVFEEIAIHAKLIKEGRYAEPVAYPASTDPSQSIHTIETESLTTWLREIFAD